MNNVVAVEIPEGVPGDAARAALLTDFGIEIGTSFGPLHGRVWRIGTMGYNAREDAVVTTLAALEDGARALRRRGGGGCRRRGGERGVRGVTPRLEATPDQVAAAARRVMARCDELARVSSAQRRDRARLPLARARAGRTASRRSGCARSA